MPRFNRFTILSSLLALCLLIPLFLGRGYAQIVHEPTPPPVTTSSDSSTPASTQKSPATPPTKEGDDVDFGPYVTKLQKTIRHNWHPPILEHHNRIKARFHIDRDGQLSELSITESKYHDPQSLNAGLAAIRKSAPFDPLPTSFKGKDVTVDFIFDYELKSPGQPTSASNNSPPKSILPHNRLGAFLFKIFEI